MGGWPVGFLHNAVEELNSGLPRTNPESGMAEDLNQGPPDFKSSALNHSAPPPPKIKALCAAYRCIIIGVHHRKQLAYTIDAKSSNFCRTWNVAITAIQNWRFCAFFCFDYRKELLTFSPRPHYTRKIWKRSFVSFLNSSGVVWTENIWCVCRVKPPFSNSSGVVWTRPPTLIGFAIA